MATPWTTTKNLSITILPRFWYDKAKDKAYLQFGRVFYGDDPNVRYRIVADLDGPVLTSFLLVSPADTVCELLDEDQRQGRYGIPITCRPITSSPGARRCSGMPLRGATAA